jgi:hypothetical protein
MPSTKKPLPGGRPIRGNGDTSTIPHGGYNGYITTAAFTALEWQAAGLDHGIATPTLHVKDGKLSRYVTSREQSFMVGNNE